MTRRKYSKRQVRPQETFNTLLILAGTVVILSVFTLPPGVIAQIIIPLLIILILIGIGVYYFYYRKQMIHRAGLRQLHIDDVDTMHGVKFEEYVAELFRLQGYRTYITKPSRDYGVDVIIMKDGVRTGIQTKRSADTVNQPAVREVVAGIKLYKCSRSMVVTNSHFAKSAVDLARTNECILVDRDGLVEMIAAREKQDVLFNNKKPG